MVEEVKIRMRRKAWRPLVFGIHLLGYRYTDEEKEEVLRWQE